ncbi:MAG: formylglycine-generating enzyme family protein, partial [Planctomycetaceae bacterium]
SETNWLHQHRPVRGGLRNFAAHGDFEELWRFVVEMPKTAADDQAWLRTVAPLFEEQPEQRTTAVCSELIYRAWPRLMELAGPPPGQPSGTADVSTEETPWCERHTHGWQKHVASAIKEGNFTTTRPPEDAPAKEWAGHLLRQFLGTFPRLAFGPNQGSERKGGANQAFGGTRDAKEIACELWDGFLRIPAGMHWMGQPNGPNDEPAHEALSSGRTSLSRYPLTNEAYALFSPRHAQQFGDYAQYSPDPRCPVIYLNWYDAWCVATWMHARLPNEYEWEAACRAQFWQSRQTQPAHQTYWFGDDQEKLKHHAWFVDNSGFQTHPIGAEGHANALGFSDMLGQVWEWTASPYATDPRKPKSGASAIVSRVLRGGAFYSSADDCRSAYRDHWPPALTDYNCGVRLARAEYL